MQVVEYNASLLPAPRIYRNRPQPAACRKAQVEPPSVVYLVDGDADLDYELSAYFSALNIGVVAFGSAVEYLNHIGQAAASCLVVNTDLPDTSGFDLQRRLNGRGGPPVIFISDRFDVASTVSAMKAGAVECLSKPVDLHALGMAVQAALEQDRRQRRKQAELAELQERFSRLTRREREVLPLVVGGLLNKQAASLLGISEVTLQIHRSQVMRKMRAESLADLVRLAMKLRVQHWREDRRSPNEERKLEHLPLHGGHAGTGMSAAL